MKLREGMSDAQGKIAQMEAEQEDNHQKLQEVSDWSISNTFFVLFPFWSRFVKKKANDNKEILFF